MFLSLEDIWGVMLQHTKKTRLSDYKEGFYKFIYYYDQCLKMYSFLIVIYERLLKPNFNFFKMWEFTNFADYFSYSNLFKAGLC